MADNDESLLDAFVTIAARGMSETERDIDDFVARVKKTFGSMEVGSKIATGVKANMRKAVDEVKEQAEKIKQSLRQSLLLFGQDKDFLSIQVRLLGDNDIKRRLQDIQSQVSAETKAFGLAEPGVAGNSERAAAIEQINSLRENELKTLQEITYEQLKQRGLDSVYENQAEALRKNAQNAQLLNQEVKELNRLISSTRDVPLIDEFSKLKTEIERAQLALRQGLASGNLVDVDDATAQLNTLRLQFDRFRDDAQKSIVIRTNAKQIADEFSQVSAALQRDEARDASKTRGNALSGNQKVALAELKHDVAAITFEFKRLSSQTDLTAKDIQELTVLLGRLKQTSSDIGEIRQQVVSLGPQMNTLSNNAYQIGQAFEDAAVGFSLNGIAGAVRGASNNITFLIQNIAQAKKAQADLLGQTVSPLITSLPLYASIGAAIGLIVVGPLQRWLEGLNDIESETRDLSNLFNNSFRDAEFLVSLQLDAQSALKAIQDAEDAEEAIEEVIRQAEESEKLRFKITAELDAVAERKVFQGIEKLTDELQLAVNERLKDVNLPKVIFGGEFGPDVIIPASEFNQEAIAKVENLNAALELLRNSFRLAQEQAADGLVPVVELENSRNAVNRLIDGYDELHKSGIISEEDAENHKKALEGLQGPLEEATEQAKKFEAAQAAILEDGLKALGLFQGISEEYKFLDAVNDGRLKKEDRILFDLQQQNVALEEQAAKARELFGNNNPLVEGAIDNREQVLREQQRIDLTGEVLNLEEEIAQQREDAAKDAERAAKRRVEIEKRIQDEREKGNERVAKAQKSLDDELNSQALADQEDRIQKRIEALQKLDVQSRNFNLGDVGTIAFGPDVKPEVERLQQELKDLRESANDAADQERIQELRDRIVSEREESQARIGELRSDLEESRQEEINALNDNAEEIQKLIEQLRLLQGAIQQNQNGGMIGIPELDANGNRNGPMFLPEGDAKAVGEAQAQANAAAMQNVDFKSSSMETLIAQSNRLLSSISTTIQNQDLQPRLV